MDLSTHRAFKEHAEQRQNWEISAVLERYRWGVRSIVSGLNSWGAMAHLGNNGSSHKVLGGGQVNLLWS